MKSDAATAFAAAAAALSVAAIALASRATTRSPRIRRVWLLSVNTFFGWRGILRSAGLDGRLPPGAPTRVNLAAAVAGATLGYMLLGAGGAALAAVSAPPAVGMALRTRRARHATRVDACAANLALALASSLAAGHSVRGALLAADAAVEQPLAGELAKVAVEVTLGSTTDDALASLRSRTASDRIDSLAGAIALHRRSGADLASLLRELAAAFRARDTARADARSAMAQARFTALIVGSIPPLAALVAELAAPGSVSGALAFPPTAILLFCAVALMFVGVLMCLRVSRV